MQKFENYKGNRISLDNTEFLANRFQIYHLSNKARLIYAKTLHNLRNSANSYGIDDDTIFKGISKLDKNNIIKGKDNYLISSYTNSKISKNLESAIEDEEEKTLFFLKAGKESAKKSKLPEYCEKLGRGIREIANMVVGGSSEFNHTKKFTINHENIGNNKYSTSIYSQQILETKIEKGIVHFIVGHFKEMEDLALDTPINFEGKQSRFSFNSQANLLKYNIIYKKEKNHLSQNLKSFGIFLNTKYKLWENKKITDKFQKEVLKKTQEQIDLRRKTYVELLKHDTESAHHTNRTSYWLAFFLKLIGASNEDLYNAICGMPVHDIGKIYVPRKVLRKEGKLTKDESLILKVPHTSLGHYKLRKIEKMKPKQADLAQFHQERANGFISGGYPNGVTWENTSLIGLASQPNDVAEALLSPRIYKSGYSFEKASSILNSISKEGGFHPLISEAFINEFLPLIKDLGLTNGIFDLQETLSQKNINISDYEYYRQKMFEAESNIARDIHQFIMGENNLFSINISSELKKFVKTHNVKPLSDKRIEKDIINALSKTYNQLDSEEYRLHLLNVTFPELRSKIITNTKNGKKKNMEEILLNFYKYGNYEIL